MESLGFIYLGELVELVCLGFSLSEFKKVVYFWEDF